MTTTRFTPSRRTILAGTAALPLVTILKWPARAAEFEARAEAAREDFDNFVLMHAMGANAAGQVASVVAGGVLLALMGAA